MLKNIFILTFLILSIGCKDKAVDPYKIASLEISNLDTNEAKKNFLIKINEDDQKVRGEEGQRLQLEYGADSEEHMAWIDKQWEMDALNLYKIEKYIDTYGYPKIKDVGKEATFAPITVIHHQTDVDIRNRNFVTIYNAFKNGDVRDVGMTFYLGRTYQMMFNKRFEMPNPFTTEDEVKAIIKEMGLDKLLVE